MVWCIDEDGDFVPSAEMYIHDDIDDERTIEEEEILEDGEQDDGELDELMKVYHQYYYLHPIHTNLHFN